MPLQGTKSGAQHNALKTAASYAVVSSVVNGQEKVTTTAVV